MVLQRQRTALLALISAEGISRFGNALTVTAIPWFVLVTTGSIARTGIVVFAAAVPVVISLFFGGVLVDQLGYRASSITGDLASGGFVALIPLLYHTIGLQFWQLVVLVFCGALLDIPAQVARYSSLPEIAGAARIPFERANAVFDGAGTLSMLFGPALAGLLIVSIGASNVLWFDAITFVISAVLIFRFLPVVQIPERKGNQSYLGDLSAGFRFIRHEPLLFPLILFFAGLNVLIGPIDVVFLPVYAREVFDNPVTLGFMLAAMAFGGLVGNLMFGILGPRLSRRTIFFWGFAAIPIALGLLSLRTNFYFSALILFGLGLGLSLANLLEYTIYFERIPKDMRARVLGITGALGWVSVPIGRLGGGFLLELATLQSALLIVALLALPMLLLLFLVPAFQSLELSVARARRSSTIDR